MSERFYVNLPLGPGPFTLDGPEAHHLTSVCRLRPGDEVCLFNGDGHEYPARITQVKRREVTLEIIGMGTFLRELPFTLEVAAPMPKGDRGQFMIEKLTEVGVTNFVPLTCQRSNLHPRDCKRDKLERYVIEASKQCGRNVLMTVGDLVNWDAYCQSGNVGDLRVLAYPPALESVANISQRSDVIRIAVGPEGGLTDEEIARTVGHDWHAISLGPRILRIETAAIVMAAHLASRAP